MRTGVTLVITVSLGWAAVGRAAAQAPELERSFLQQIRTVDEQLARQRQEAAPLSERLDFQWGGWVEYYVFDFDDGVQSSRVVQRPSLALWSRITADGGAHEVFARMRLRYSYFNPGDEIERQQDWWGPNFDAAWYRIDFGRAFRWTQPSDPFQASARIGRQPVRFGSGYVLDLPLDAVLLDAKLHDFRVLGLLGKSIGSYPNIDRSEPVDSHSNRLFYGVQLQYERWTRHVPFVYAIWNDDKTDERPKTWFQDYSYDSFYFGGGTRGELARNLLYWVEGVFESGHSFGNGNFVRQDYVEAYGWDIGAEYLFDGDLKPRLSAEYMFASGDPQRRFSPTDAAGGNEGDREDSSLVTFGWRDTGIASALIPANLHIWKAGGSLTPFGKHKLLEGIEVGTNFFLYHKNSTPAAISDFTAYRAAGFVGWEMDYFLDWRLSSDVSWTIRWGTFFPGDAFADRDERHFLFTGLTWSF